MFLKDNSNSNMYSYVGYLRNLKCLGNICRPSSLLLREVYKASGTTGRDEFYIREEEKHVLKDRIFERRGKMQQTSYFVDLRYGIHFKSMPSFHDARALLKDMETAANQISKSNAFIRGYSATLDCFYKLGDCDFMPKSVVPKLRSHFGGMSELELEALLLYVVNSNRYNEFVEWSGSSKMIFILLDREISRRLYACYELGIYENKETVAFFEVILQMLINSKCGLHCFRAYTTFCTCYFHELVNEDNFSLLLLSVLKIYNSSFALFDYIEKYMLRHLESFDIETVALCALVFIICDRQVYSVKLLDQIGDKLLKSLSKDSKKSLHTSDIVDILKLLRHSEYSKVSFYHELEPLLLRYEYSLRTLMTVLHAFGSVKIFPSNLSDAFVKQFKSKLSNSDEGRARTKDISKFVNTLGKFCYWDNESLDIYTMCADEIVQKLKLYRRNARNEAQVAVALVDMVTGLLYVGKFHEKLLDTLFVIPDVVNLLEGTKGEDLLLIHNTVKLMYPEYSGRRINQTLINKLEQKLAKKNTVEVALRKSDDLNDCATVLRLLIGDNKLRTRFILPHIKTLDVELFLNEKNELVEPEFATKKVALEIIGFHKCRRGTDILMGKYKLKLKQLVLMGYKIIMVFPSEKKEVYNLGTLEEKEEFWIRKLQNNGINFDLTRKRATPVS